MRASMAVPGVVAPAELDNRLLIDGGLTRNLPVDIVRAMGADVVIAVNLGAPLLPLASTGTLLSGSVYGAIDTVLGPVFVACGHARGGSRSLYPYLGRP